MTENDADNPEEYLRPVERDILTFAKTHPDLPFCWREFVPKYAHGTIRNAFSKLANLQLLDLWCRSSDAYYILHTLGRRITRQAVTLAHTRGRYDTKKIQFDFFSFLDSLDWEEICKVHDIVLNFEVPHLYDEVLQDHKCTVTEQSRDIQFATFEWLNNRSLKAILHRNGTVNCYLKCSECPIEVTPEGLVSLSSFLGGVRTRLTDELDAPSHAFNEKAVPDVSSWVVTQWHYGKDGKQEISGPAFNVTFKVWSGTLARIYMKKNGEHSKVRLETIDKPRKTLPQAFSEKMNSEK